MSPRSTRILALILPVLALITGCTLPTSSDDADGDAALIEGPPEVVIAAPLPNAAFLEGVQVVIQASIRNAGPDIERVEVAVDGATIATQPQPNTAGATIFAVTQMWAATTTGTHEITVTALRGDGSSGSDSVTINVVGEQMLAATATPTVQPTNTAAPQPTDPPEPTDEPEPTDPPASATPSVPTARFTSGVNARSGPGTNFDPPLGAFVANDTAEILAVHTGGLWLKVRWGAGEAWVYEPLVDVEGDIGGLPREAGPPTPVPPPPTAIPATNTPQAQINLVAEQPFIDPPVPQCGQQFTAGFTIRNASNVATTTGLARIQLVRVADGQVFRSSESALVAVNLAPGGTHRVAFQFTVDVFVNETHRVEFIVDVNGQVAETNENDNRIGVDYPFGDCP